MSFAAINAGESLDVEKMLKIINERITYLYDREHTIGHAIFMKLTKEGENTLDNLASIFAKGIYHDKWIGGVLHYTGMGKNGDQDINWAQNATLAGCGRNGVDIHLFEVMDAGEYVYCGRIELVDKPYTETQPGEDGAPRKVWMFPIRPVPDNDVKKPAMFVFTDMDDYKTRGKNVDAEYAKIMAAKKKRSGKSVASIAPVIPKPEPKPVFVVPADVVGKQIKH